MADPSKTACGAGLRVTVFAELRRMRMHEANAADARKTGQTRSGTDGASALPELPEVRG
jgi:hypothetical protein